MKGKLKIFKYDKDFGIGLEVYKNNESCFESIEETINKEVGLEKKVNLIMEEKYQNVYPKLYTYDNGK